jgi:dolichyl-phosphate beta-glucosyltransferase
MTYTEEKMAGRLKLVIPQDTITAGDVADHDLTLVIPAYNEANRLPKTLADAKIFLDASGINYRVLVVDDGSRDATPTITNDFGLRFSTISQPNGGKGAAVRLGMLAARGRVIAFTDADLPYDLIALKNAYTLISTGRRDVVFGSRTAAGSSSLVGRRFARALASAVFRFMMRILVSRKVTDTQCGLKVFSRNAARQIFSQATINGFAFDAEVVYLAHFLDLSLQTMPVTLVNEYSTTISLSRNAIPMLMDVLRVRLKSLRGEYRAGATVVLPPPAIESTRKAA